MIITNTLGNSDYIIHHPNKVDLYAVTREQLELLSLGATSEWKGYFQNALSIFMTCIINILALGFDVGSKSFSLNVGLGIFAILICIFSFCMKSKDENKHSTRLNEILSQPVQKINVAEDEVKLKKSGAFTLLMC